MWRKNCNNCQQKPRLLQISKIKCKIPQKPAHNNLSRLFFVSWVTTSTTQKSFLYVGTGNFFGAKLWLLTWVVRRSFGICERYAALKFPNCPNLGSMKIFCGNENFDTTLEQTYGALTLRCGGCVASKNQEFLLALWWYADCCSLGSSIENCPWLQHCAGV